MLEHELHFLLLQAFQYNSKAITKEILSLGLFPGQPKILEYLLEHNGAVAKEIGTGCVLDKSTITSLLLRMEKQDLIVRKKHDSDTRSSYIYLTQKGMSLARKVKKLFSEIDETAFQTVSEKEREHFLETLQTIIHNLQEAQS